MSDNVPYSQEAEEAVLGAILIAPGVYDLIADKLTPDDFYFLRHSYIFQSMQRVMSDGLALDNLTLADDLNRAGLLADINGPSFLTHLIANTPTSQHAEVYAELVRRTSVRRKLLVMADDIRGLAVDETRTTDEVLMDIGKELAKVSLFFSRQDVTLSDQVDDYEAYIEERWRQAEAGNPHPYATGYHNLKPLVPGFEPGEYVIIGGRPGSGKTALVLCIAQRMVERGITCRIMSLEMSVNALIHRMVSQRAVISGKHIKANGLSNEQRAQVTAEYNNIRQIPNLSLTRPKAQANIETIVADIRQATNEGCEVYFLDYVNLMAGTGRQSEYEICAEASRRFKQLAVELGIIIVAGAQLSRGLENRQDKRPKASDLKQAGEQDADITLLLYREVMYDDASERPNEAQLIVAKNRNGAMGTCALYYDMDTTRFLDGARRTVRLSDEPPPQTHTHYSSPDF